jgi:phosphoenolpyruvate-protein kinase (PTS system EI component)
MGVDQLSMSATYIPVMANLFSRLTRKDLDEYLKLVEDMCNTATGQEILDACTAWMAQKIPEFSEIAM